MTIPPTSAASPPDPAGPGVSSAPGSQTSEGLGWLLNDFLAQVPGTQGAFLVARDGLVTAAAGLTGDEADHAAAVAAALYSAAGAAGKITSPPAGDVQQIIVQHDTRYTILMSTPDQPSGGPAAVGCVLGVLAGHDAHTGLVGDRMAALIVSVAKHLVTATRTGPSDVRAAAGLEDEGRGDER